MASTAVFNGALSASPSFVLMVLCLLDLVALSNHHTAVFNGGYVCLMALVLMGLELF